MTVAAELLGGYDIARRDHRGLVVSRDGTVIRMRPGDTVWTPPGDERWHAATADNMMCHLAMLDGVPGGDGPGPVTTAPPFEDLHVGPAPD